MKIAVVGASGRMGQAVISAIKQSSSQLGAAIVSDGSAFLGQAIEHTHYQSWQQLQPAPNTSIDVIIDFSLPAALEANLAFARQHQLPIVVCTTGLNEQQQQQLHECAKAIPLLYARNTSVGVALLEQLVALSAAALPQADIEVFEAHHKHKKDGPSGTALALGEAAAAGRQQNFTQVNAGIRGDGERQPDSIGFSVLRAADIVGEHQVMLAQSGERIELSHRVSDRAIFAQGALDAAQWLQQQQAGYYQMQDILNLTAIMQRLVARAE